MSKQQTAVEDDEYRQCFFELFFSHSGESTVRHLERLLSDEARLLAYLVNEKIALTFYDYCRTAGVKLPPDLSLELKRFSSECESLRRTYSDVLDTVSEGDRKSYQIVKGPSMESLYRNGWRRDWHDIDIFFRDLDSFNAVFARLKKSGYSIYRRAGTYWYKTRDHRTIASLFIHNSDNPAHQVECQIGLFPLTWSTGLPFCELVTASGEMSSVSRHVFYWGSLKVNERAKFKIRDLLDIQALLRAFPLNSSQLNQLQDQLVSYGLVGASEMSVVNFISTKPEADWSFLLGHRLGYEDTKNRWHFRQWGRRFAQPWIKLWLEEKWKKITEAPAPRLHRGLRLLEPALVSMLYKIKVPLYFCKPIAGKKSRFQIVEIGGEVGELRLFEPREYGSRVTP